MTDQQHDAAWQAVAWTAQTMKPHLVLRADMAVASTLWVCQSTDDEHRYYRAASPVAKVTHRMNTDDLRKAARFPTREAAEQARELDRDGEPLGFDENTGALCCLPPGRWQSAEAPPAEYACPPEIECTECHGVRGGAYGHARWDCAILRKDARFREAAAQGPRKT
jgi:hypothetical protein